MSTEQIERKGCSASFGVSAHDGQSNVRSSRFGSCPVVHAADEHHEHSQLSHVLPF